MLAVLAALALAAAAERSGDPCRAASAPMARPIDLRSPRSARSATSSYPYPDRARALRARSLETLAAIAQGPQVCGCAGGDATKGLAELARGEAGAKTGAPPPARDLAKAGADALSALKSGRAKVQWLRASPGAPATGCAGGP